MRTDLASTRSPAIWTGRSPLQRTLSGVVGGLIGGGVSLVLFLVFQTHAWWVYLPIAVAALLGFWKLDRALLGMLRWIGRVASFG